MTGVTDENSAGPGLGRRPLLKVAAGAAALTSVTVAARLTRGPETSDSSHGALVLASHADSDVLSLHLPLGDDLLVRQGVRRWETRRLPTSTHSMVALTWATGAPPPTARIRTRRRGVWSGWESVPLDLDVPAGEQTQKATIRGSDLMWVGRADGIQVQIDGQRPRGLSLLLLYPQLRRTDGAVEQGSNRTGSFTRATTEARVPEPDLVTREQWGADESLRSGRPTYNDTLKQVHVHHTVSANTYARRDVPALIRGMYAYHTQTLGWSDIGYNFLVDRFGRAFVGRAGGPRRLVRGAHTLGFNAESAGVSAIGNYETAQPTDAMLDAIAAIAAWKLDRFDRDARGTIRVESEGSDKFPPGRVVRLPVIDGHRDTNDTACPGHYLYEALPKIRRRAARRIEAAHRAILVQSPASVTGRAVVGELLQAHPGTFTPVGAEVTYQWLRGGRPIANAAGATYRLRPGDLGAVVGCTVTLSETGATSVVQQPPGLGPVMARPALTVEASSRRRIVRVAVTVNPPRGVADLPAGTVVVQVADRFRTRSLADGGVEVKLGRRRRFRNGTYPVRVTYEGNDLFLPADWSGTVDVRA